MNVVRHHDWSPCLEMEGWCFLHCDALYSCHFTSTLQMDEKQLGQEEVFHHFLLLFGMERWRIHWDGNVSRSLLSHLTKVHNDFQHVAITYCESYSVLICAWKAINNSSDIKVRGYSHKSKPADWLGKRPQEVLSFPSGVMVQAPSARHSKVSQAKQRRAEASQPQLVVTHTDVHAAITVFRLTLAPTTVYYGSTEIFTFCQLTFVLILFGLVDSQWSNSFSSQLATFRHLSSPLHASSRHTRKTMAPLAPALSHSFSIFGGQTHPSLTHKVCY